MARLIVVLGLATGLVVALVGASRYWLPESRAYHEQRGAIALQVQEAQANLQLEAARTRQTQEQARAAQQHAQAMARDRSLYRLGVAVRGFWMAAPAALVTLAAIVAFRFLWSRSGLVWPSQAGYLPLERSEIRALTAVAVGLLERSHASQEARALALIASSTQQMPEHYAPSFSYHAGNRRNEALAAPDEVPTVRVEVPTYQELLNRGQIGPGAPLLLGYAQSGALVGDWRDVYSSAIAGATGSGKTTTTRFLACQSALHGARFVILDPHALAGSESLAGTLEPLAAAFVTSPAVDERDMLHAVGLVSRELDHRLRGKDGPPWIVAVDEFTALMARGSLAGPLATLLEKIAQEGRKKGVFALLNGQVWRGDRAGSTPLRDSLASAFVHRSRRNQARFLLPTEDAARAERLPTGAALLYRTSGEVLQVQIPNTTAYDVEATARRLVGRPGPFPAISPPLPREAAQAPGSPAEGEAEGGAETEQVLYLLAEGMSHSEIIKTVYGATGGRAYQRASQQVSAIIAQALRAQGITQPEAG